ncbi:hypothetical protein COO60DRAFT_810745 [Scenedesmus sp. NREL 46B-D3]|nr:hypothetical protein COO60DRAFT_810745 [Scenedesmus sp. NREL 46B-D3]
MMLRQRAVAWLVCSVSAGFSAAEHSTARCQCRRKRPAHVLLPSPFMAPYVCFTQVQQCWTFLIQQCTVHDMCMLCIHCVRVCMQAFIAYTKKQYEHVQGRTEKGRMVVPVIMFGFGDHLRSVCL